MVSKTVMFLCVILKYKPWGVGGYWVKGHAHPSTYKLLYIPRSPSENTVSELNHVLLHDIDLSDVIILFCLKNSEQPEGRRPARGFTVIFLSCKANARA